MEIDFINYIAGFFDGEGCFYMRYRKSKGFDNSVTMTQGKDRGKELLLKIKDHFGYGTVHKKGHELWEYRINKKEYVEDFINKVLPFIHIKKSEAIIFLKIMRQWKEEKTLPNNLQNWRVSQH